MGYFLGKEVNANEPAFKYLRKKKMSHVIDLLYNLPKTFLYQHSSVFKFRKQMQEPRNSKLVYSRTKMKKITIENIITKSFIHAINTTAIFCKI